MKGPTKLQHLDSLLQRVWGHCDNEEDPENKLRLKMLKKSSFVADTPVVEDVYIEKEGDELHTERSSGILKHNPLLYSI